MSNPRFRALLSFSVLIAIASCGDGPGFSGIGDGVAPPAGGPPPPPPQQGTFVTLTSDTDDYIGAGENYAYTLADALITVTAQDGLLTVDIDGDEWWTGEFQLPDVYPSLEVGTYNNLTRYPFHDAAVGGLNWSGEGRGCNMLDALLTIDSVTYNGAELTDIALSFEQYCEGGTAALRGQIQFDASDTTTPPGPVVPAPNDLWSPMQGVTPDTGNYVYLTSQQGDFIGGGADYLYTDATATITVDATDGNLSVSVRGAEDWNGEFQVMNFLTQIEAGYYGDLQRYPFHNPVKGGLSWSGDGRGCNTLTGWFVVDSVIYDTGAVTAVDLRFEQHCEGGTPALFGEIHWVM